MVNSMLDFEFLNNELSKIAREKSCKIWICEKIGKRFSCIARYGEEQYTESEVIYEDEKYIVFVENVTEEILKAHITEVIKNARKE